LYTSSIVIEVDLLMSAQKSAITSSRYYADE
jgi:hypothetical protein